MAKASGAMTRLPCLTARAVLAIVALARVVPLGTRALHVAAQQCAMLRPLPGIAQVVVGRRTHALR